MFSKYCLDDTSNNAAAFESELRDYICNNKWKLPDTLTSNFHELVRDIRAIILPNYNTEDTLVLDLTDDSQSSLKSAYEAVATGVIIYPKYSTIWHNLVPPRYSIIMWRLFRNKLATDDQLRKGGMNTVPCCLMCYTCNSCEDANHLFIQCNFAKESD